MDDNRIVRALARVSRRRPQEIEAHLSLTTLGLSSSFGLSALRSLLEAENEVHLPPLNANMKVSEIFDLMSGPSEPSPREASHGWPMPAAAMRAAAREPSRMPTAAVGGSSSLLRGLGLGMDMEEIESMPLTTDFRGHDFYASHFLPSEIATALLKPDARAHFCGLFCAKEAAKKSHPDLLDLRMNGFVVRHDASGRPLLDIIEGDPQHGRFIFILSITHTARAAAAACLTLEAPDAT